MKDRLMAVFEKVIAAVFGAIIVVLTIAIGIVIGTVRLFINLGSLATTGRHYRPVSAYHL